MHKSSRNLLLGLILLVLPAGCRSGQEPSTEEINALKTNVQSGSPPAFVPQTDDGMKVWSTTRKVYELRGYRPVAIAQGQTTSRIDSLIRTFESTEAEGFSAEDLGMADLHAKREAIKTSKELEHLVEFDIFFTYSLVRCGSYLSSGRADPRTIDPNWRYVPRNDNLAQIINDAIETNTLENLPGKLAPPHAEYVALKEMLRKYREIGAKGGWTALPVDLTLKLGEDNRVADIKFQGKGCAISQASASMMTDMLKGRTAAEADRLMKGFLHLVKGEDASDLPEDDRERLEVMGGISEFPMRVKCATLAWHTLKSALTGAASEPVSTE
jgi:nitrogen fixation NifU-like protein